MQPREYKIGERTYVLKKLVLGQLSDLAKIYKKYTKELTTEDDNSYMQLIVSMLESGDLTKLLGIVLCEKGKHLKEKDIDEVTQYMEENLEMDEMMEIIKDFFTMIGLPIEPLPNKATKGGKTSR